MKSPISPHIITVSQKRINTKRKFQRPSAKSPHPTHPLQVQKRSRIVRLLVVFRSAYTKAKMIDATVARIMTIATTKLKIRNPLLMALSLRYFAPIEA